MQLDAHTIFVLLIGPMIGWVMVQAGLFKQMLDRDHDRVCPSCGRFAKSCVCV